MPIHSDCHLHSSCSGDSDTPMEEMILRGISLGLTSMCFTEHQDIAYPPSPEQPENIFLLDTDSYLDEFVRLKEKYRDRIRLLWGVELGLQPEISAENTAYARSRKFDFIIASSHICHGKDPYYPSFFQGRSEEDAIREYFESILENIGQFSDYDVYGHLDYVVRYAPSLDRHYSCDRYRELLDAILKQLLKKGKGLELNTGGIKKGLKDFHPCQTILKRYRELGGEIITLGSDAHDTVHIADYFDRAASVLKECGFRYYTVFKNRTPEFIRL